MNANEPVALTQGDILGILQDANSVPLGQPIFNSSEEYNKLKAIIESAIRYTHPVKEQDTDCQYCKQGCIRCDARKQLTDEEIYAEMVKCIDSPSDGHEFRYKDFARAILRKAREK